MPESVSLPQLVKVIEGDYDPTVQMQAIESIANLDSDASRSLLKKYAWRHREEMVRGEAVESLADALPEKEALKVLSEIAERHESPETQRRAVEKVGDIDSNEARRILDRVIAGDHPPEIQRQAVESLGNRHDPDVLEVLSRIARTHKQPGVRRQAVEMIGHLGTDEAVTELERLLKQQH
jgi:HEAT repeat protein